MSNLRKNYECKFKESLKKSNSNFFDKTNSDLVPFRIEFEKKFPELKTVFNIDFMPEIDTEYAVYIFLVNGIFLVRVLYNNKFDFASIEDVKKLTKYDFNHIKGRDLRSKILVGHKLHEELCASKM